MLLSCSPLNSFKMKSNNILNDMKVVAKIVCIFLLVFGLFNFMVWLFQLIFNV